MNALHALMLSAWSAAWKLARPALRRNQRLSDGFDERLAAWGWVCPPVRPDGTHGFDIWFQAASGGEARLACTLLEAMEQTPSPPASVLAVTWTRQGRDTLEKCTRDMRIRVDVRFAPFDATDVVQRALEQANPSLVVLLETELWPGLMSVCEKKGIPVLILNGRLTVKTTRQYLRLSGLFRAMAPRRIAAISPVDAERFSSLFPDTPVQTVANIKFDQTASLLAQNVETDASRDRIRNILGGSTLPLVLFASTREEEEATLFQAFRKNPLLFQAARLIVAPRHMHRLFAWQEQLDALGIPCVLRSTLEERQHPLPRGEVVLWDTFGELPWLYSMADAVFVGGSLAPLGGQNFLEPLAAGVIPYVGPSTGNFAWALETEGERLEHIGLLHRVGNVEELIDRLAGEIAAGPLPDAKREETRSRFTAWLARHQGGTAVQAGLIAQMLEAGKAY